jgi:hypothetical protein
MLLLQLTRNTRFPPRRENRQELRLRLHTSLRKYKIPAGIVAVSLLWAGFLVSYREISPAQVDAARDFQILESTQTVSDEDTAALGAERY